MIFLYIYEDKPNGKFMILLPTLSTILIRKIHFEKLNRHNAEFTNTIKDLIEHNLKLLNYAHLGTHHSSIDDT